MSLSPRTPAHPIQSTFIDRWSPRSFLSEEIPDRVLLTAFEAARWAPSASNLQPWRLLYAKRESPAWTTFLTLPSENNRRWAQHAAALVLFVSESHFLKGDERMASPTHAFDTGAAWSNFAHQLHLLGWHTHAMAGFDKALAHTALSIPQDFQPHALVAVGKIGPPETLPEALLKREFPSDRRPLASLIFEGEFSEEKKIKN